MQTETKRYSDGTTATGTAPLPNISPDQQDNVKTALVEARKFVEWPAGSDEQQRVLALIDKALALIS